MLTQPAEPVLMTQAAGPAHSLFIPKSQCSNMEYDPSLISLHSSAGLTVLHIALYLRPIVI